MWAEAQTRQCGKYTEPLTDDGRESRGLWKGVGETPGRCLLFKVWLREPGFSQDVNFSSLKLQVLLLKASRDPGKVSGSATVTFRASWPFDTGRNVPVCLRGPQSRDGAVLACGRTEPGRGTAGPKSQLLGLGRRSAYPGA